MKEQNIYRLYASYYYNLGLNVTCIHNKKTNYNSLPYSKSPYHEWAPLKTARQKYNEVLNYDWGNASGVGAMLGYNNIRAIDIDNCSSKKFISGVLRILSLPSNYEWLVQSGSTNGYHVYFQCPGNKFFPNDGKVKAFLPNLNNKNCFQKMEFRFHNHIVLPPSIHSSSNKYSFVNVDIPQKEPLQVCFSDLSLLIGNVAHLELKSSYIEILEADSGNFVAIERTIPSENDNPSGFNIDEFESESFTEMNVDSPIQKPKITLRRPLIYFDAETTGVDRVRDRIIELCTIKYFPDGESELITQRFNPTIPIPESATEVHSIMDVDVRNKPTFADKAKKIAEYFRNCDLAGYNIIEFDLPILVEEFLRAQVSLPFNNDTKYLDALKIFHNNEKRDLTAAYKFYCGKDLEDAHSAEVDVLVTIEVLNGQIEKYGLEKSIDALHSISNNDGELIDYERKFKRNDDGKIVFTFGKNKGMSVEDEISYLEWMLTADFSNYTKLIVKKILAGKIK